MNSKQFFLTCIYGFNGREKREPLWAALQSISSHIGQVPWCVAGDLNFREANSQYLVWLHQKAKLHWLQMGDSNSKIFYNSLKARTSRNTINRLIDGQGNWIEDMDGITEAFTKFYRSLITGGEHRTHLIPEVVHLGATLTEQHQH
ncbi:Thioredoxin reductase 1 mitochondrial, partial [Bienertia sinuspersici]